MPALSAARGKLSSLPHSARAALVCAALAVWWISTLEIHRSWAWDESMHAELPALRMLLSVQAGDGHGFWSVLHSCQQYPFGWPLVLGALQAVFGVSEWIARAAGITVWCVTLLGLFLLTQEVARAQRSGGPRRGDDLAPWLALAFGALSPLCLGYGGSLFLEVPFTCCAVFALRAWLRRGNLRDEPGGLWRAIAAGLWLVAAFFTKFNYGILLVFGCGLDGLLGLLSARRAGRLGRELRDLLLVAVPLVLGAAWWLVLPLPFGLEKGAEHREVMLSFLGGNREMPSTPWEQRLIFWALYLTFTARFFVVQLVGVASSLRGLLQPGARLMWVVLLAAGLPVWTHNFHLDRFLIPNAPTFWVLAALGLAGILPMGAIRRVAVLTPLALAALLFPTADASRVAGWLGLLEGDEDTSVYIVGVLEEKPRLGEDRRMWTPGMAPEAAEAVLELVTAEVGPAERVGWIGVSTELPPAVLHIALFEASGNRARFLADAHRPLDVDYFNVDPNWDVARLREFVEQFDVLITTDPSDIGQRPARAFARRYAGMLIGELGWGVTEIGKVLVPKDVGDGFDLSVFALRPPAR
jgi:hypothetical protein